MVKNRDFCLTGLTFLEQLKRGYKPVMYSSYLWEG